MDWSEPADGMRLAAVCCRPDRGRWTLTLSRVTGHPAPRVWAALTEPDLLARWAPGVPDRRLDRTGPVLLTVPGSDGDERQPAEVLRCEPGSVLVYGTEEDEVGFELADADGGTATTLRHTFLEQDWACELATAWHQHLEALDRLLAGCGPAGDEAVPAPPDRHLLRLAYGRQLALAAPIFDS